MERTATFLALTRVRPFGRPSAPAVWIGTVTGVQVALTRGSALDHEFRIELLAIRLES